MLNLLMEPHDAKVFTIQTNFQRNKDNHPVWDLPNASNGKALILQVPKMLSFNFCLRKRSQVAVHDIRFSNGNMSETVVVDIDGVPVGTFQTPTTPDWNQFRSTGVLTGGSMMSLGWHYVTVIAVFITFFVFRLLCLCHQPLQNFIFLQPISNNLII